MAKNNKPGPRKPGKLSVYLYIPNIIGYTRVFMNCYAFAICFSNKWLFCALYFISFVCDGVDGWCARKFNQVSTFGAVLDMVTDRYFLFHIRYIPNLNFSCSFTFLLGKVSHKDVKDSTNWLFKAYYGNRMFMAYCCVACEVLYITLFLLAKNDSEKLMDVLKASITEGSPISVLVGLSLFGWAIKQLVNVIQVPTNTSIILIGTCGQSLKMKEIVDVEISIHSFILIH
ncbi:hypothetical protein POTOM_016060 [Populus tomentosa]|uniref:CDP-diacylglycerol--inositol 3-phosphatidyltransferase n=1 Tax=Populus tomentosa TaxID=118781 RepID=A0A8X8A310_POPTO|nr:hypothetical protein POTOM_016060 [Populus tomentosa]